jgi:hypothetical protein
MNFVSYCIALATTAIEGNTITEVTLAARIAAAGSGATLHIYGDENLASTKSPSPLC